jgi:uncharacterized protein YukE
MSLDRNLGAAPEAAPANAVQVEENTIATIKRRMQEDIDVLQVGWNGLQCAVIDVNLAV